MNEMDSKPVDLCAVLWNSVDTSFEATPVNEFVDRFVIGDL